MRSLKAGLALRHRRRHRGQALLHRRIMDARRGDAAADGAGVFLEKAMSRAPLAALARAAISSSFWVAKASQLLVRGRFWFRCPDPPGHAAASSSAPIISSSPCSILARSIRRSASVRPVFQILRPSTRPSDRTAFAAAAPGANRLKLLAARAPDRHARPPPAARPGRAIVVHRAEIGGQHDLDRHRRPAPRIGVVEARRGRRRRDRRPERARRSAPIPPRLRPEPRAPAR